MANKIKKNINVSIQSKKYFSPINNILQDWEEDGLNISTEVCESILLAEKVANSPTLLSVMKLYDLTEQILYLNGIQDSEQKLEDVLSLLISVNGDGLTDIINSSFDKTNKSQRKKNLNKSVKEQHPTENKSRSSNELIPNKVEYIKDDSEYVDVYDKDDTENEDDNGNEYMIPSDIFFND